VFRSRNSPHGTADQRCSVFRMIAADMPKPPARGCPGVRCALVGSLQGFGNPLSGHRSGRRPEL